MATRSPAKNASKPAKKTARKTTGKTVRKTVAKTARKAARPAKPKVKRVPRLASLSHGHFAPRLHQQFLIRPESGAPIKAELISVTDLGQRPTAKKGHVRQRTFSIILRGPQSDAYLPQRIYSVEHGRLGKHKIFLVPIGPDEHGMRYEAVFN